MENFGVIYYIIFMEKKCSKCGEVKSLSEFHKRKDSKDGHRADCIVCRTNHGKEYRENNRELILKRKKKYYEDNRERLKVKYDEYRKNNKDKIIEYRRRNRENILRKKREYYRENREELLKKKKVYRKENPHKDIEYRKNNKDKLIKWRKENKESIKKWSREYYKKRCESDTMFKMIQSVRNNIRITISTKKWTKKSKTYQYLGCDWITFKEHIESKFTEGMSWDNHGEWHYDHYYPISLVKEEKDLMILNHYTNFRPLWAKDNLEKSNKVPDGYEEWYEEISKTRPYF